MQEGETRVTGAVGARVEVDVESVSSSGGGALDAVYGAAVSFTDRCFVHLESPDETHIRVVLRVKPGLSLDAAKLEQELRLELDDQAFRDSLVRGDVPSARVAPPLPSPASEIDVEDLRSFKDGDGEEDPLAMALRWEEKHLGRTT